MEKPPQLTELNGIAIQRLAGGAHGPQFLAGAERKRKHREKMREQNHGKPLPMGNLNHDSVRFRVWKSSQAKKAWAKLNAQCATRTETVKTRANWKTLADQHGLAT